MMYFFQPALLRRLFAWFTRIGVVITLISMGAFAQTVPDGIRVMEREKSLAEQFLVLLNTFGPKDTSQYARGISLYAEAKADFDGLITELEYELDQAQPPKFNRAPCVMFVRFDQG